MMAATRNRNALVWGIILILIGLIFITDRMNINLFDFVARLWPLILIFWGVWKLYFGLKERKDEQETGLTQDQP
jgi:putative Mn2+ efflux pump MntP